MLEGDRPIALDAAVMDMALAGPPLGQSMDIYGLVAKTTTAACGSRPRVFGERAVIPGELPIAFIRRNPRPTFVVALLSGDNATGLIRAK